MKQFAHSPLTVLILGFCCSTYPAIAMALDNPSGRSVACIVNKFATPNPGAETPSDLPLLSIFENIRQKGGNRWSQDAWKRRFSEFNSEQQAVAASIIAEESSLQIINMRRLLTDKFSLPELAQRCSIIEDPYLVQFQEKAAANVKVANALIAAKTSGQAMSEAERKALMTQAEQAEQDMQLFMKSNQAHASKLANSPVFQRWVALNEKELRLATARLNQAFNSDPHWQRLLAKWEAIAKGGEQNSEIGAAPAPQKP